MTLGRVCVYCASSRQSDAAYFEAAASLGRSLAECGVTIVYGGGAVGSMGALADAALAAGGKVVGVLPRFMYDLEWGHPRLTELRLVGDLHERQRLMIEEVDAIVALPGGSGTLEELMEAITWKRLGLHGHPIVLVNVRGFFDPLIAPRALHRRALHGPTASRHVDGRRRRRRGRRGHPQGAAVGTGRAPLRPRVAVAGACAPAGSSA